MTTLTLDRNIHLGKTHFSTVEELQTALREWQYEQDLDARLVQAKASGKFVDA